MKTAFRTAALFVLVMLSGCGRDSFESLRKQQVETLREAADTLGTIKDADSAAKAKPKLKQLGDRWRDLEKRLDATAKTPADEDKSKPLTDELNTLVVRYLAEAVRVTFVPGGQDALKEIGEVKKKP